MSKREKMLYLLNNKELMIEIEKVFKTSYSGYGEIKDKEVAVFIYYMTLYCMNKILDEKTINKTTGSIVSDSQVKKGLNFDNTIAAMTALNDRYTFEFSEYLKYLLKEKCIVSFIFVASAVGHEIFHIYQRQNIENNVISIESLTDSLEFISRMQDESFYDRNYNELHFEITAELAGIYLSISFIEEIIGRKLNTNELDYIKYLFVDNNSKNLHKFDTEESTISYLNSLIDNVKDYVKLNPDLLTKFPVIQTIFDKNGNLRCTDDILSVGSTLIDFNISTEKDLTEYFTIILKSFKQNTKEYYKK